MTMQLRFFLVVVWVLIFLSTPSLAQSPAGRQTDSAPQAQAQSPSLPPNANSIETVANEIGLLRKSLQTLNSRLREISEKVSATGSTASGTPGEPRDSISRNLELLTRVEQRAELLRRQLFEVIEKETSLRGRLVQIEDDMRPESLERTMNLVGTTRTLEMRDARRRVLETERRGVDSLLIQTGQNRVRLEEDVRQSDALVSRLRQRLLPLIDKEVDKLTPE